MAIETRAVRMWASLTDELGWSWSPVKAFLAERFPHLREIQREYRESVGEIVLPGVDRYRGTMGTAFDWLMRFMVCSEPDVHLALAGARPFRLLFKATGYMAIQMGVKLVVVGEGRKRLGVSRFDGPGEPSAADEETLLRGCWALALLTEVYRSRMPMPGSPLLDLDLETVRAADLLALAPAETLAELAELRKLAEVALLPRLRERRGLWAVGPTFQGSRLMNADADLVAAGLMLEIKTTLGDKRRDGSRRCSVGTDTLYQMLGYVLLDFDDEFGLDAVGLYAARYGHLAIWELSNLLDRLAGRRVDLRGERQAFKALLLNGRPLAERLSEIGRPR